MRQYIWLSLLLAAMAVLGVGGALKLSLKAQNEGLQYEQEWVRALLQVGLIAVLGIVTSGVLERFKDRLQQRRDDSRIRFDVLKELSRAYMDVKLVRRKIQATNIVSDIETDALNQNQALFEMHMHNSAPLFQKGRALAGHLGTMEDYLNKVANKPQSVERLNFTARGFNTFSDAYGEAAKLMREEITGR